MMAGIRGRNTTPELIVRRGLHAMGFRFRLHDRALPGKPDLVLPKWKAIIFVNGCFWHGHDCDLFRWPSTREQFWRQKIGRNIERDAEVAVLLDQVGWRVLNIWECSLKGKHRIGAGAVIEAAAIWLRSDRKQGEIRGTDGAGR